MPFTANLELPYTVIIPNREDWILHRENLVSAYRYWLTDSSKTLSGSGVGAYCCGLRADTSNCLASYALIQLDIHASALCVERLMESDFGFP